MLKINKKLKTLLLYIFIIILTLTFFKIIYDNSNFTSIVTKDSNIEEKKVIEKNDYYKINVLMPKFDNIKINSICKNYIKGYIKNFKIRCDRKYKNTLTVDYNLVFLDKYMIIFFNIYDTTNNKRVNKSIIIDTLNNNKISVEDFIDKKEEFNLIVKNKINKKYSKDVSKILNKVNINNYDIFIKENIFYITFNDLKNNINYVPNINFKISKKINESVFKEVNSKNNLIMKKYIALTFDDGPNKESTNQVIDALVENDAKGTFFVLGSRIKYNKEIMFRQIALGNEVGSHSYSHKNLARLNNKTFEEELNSTNIIYNEIMGRKINLLRPPYGSYNNYVCENAGMPLILWSIDTKDWLSRNAKKISDHVINNAKDGDIILMHDIYLSTAEAVRIIAPELKEKGFELVTVSELARLKKIKLEKGKVYRNFN